MCFRTVDAGKDGFALVVDVDGGNEFLATMVCGGEGRVVGVEGGEGVGEDGAVGGGKCFITDKKELKKKNKTKQYHSTGYLINKPLLFSPGTWCNQGA